jgi:hypothetical protein
MTKEDLKAKFPDHDAWKNEEQWYPKLCKALAHGATRRNILDPDIVYDMKFLPFYPKILNYYVRSKHRAAILHGNAKYATDGEELCSLLMKDSVGAITVLDEGPLQKRMWYVICSLACWAWR